VKTTRGSQVFTEHNLGAVTLAKIGKGGKKQKRLTPMGLLRIAMVPSSICDSIVAKMIGDAVTRPTVSAARVRTACCLSYSVALRVRHKIARELLPPAVQPHCVEVPTTPISSDFKPHPRVAVLPGVNPLCEQAMVVGIKYKFDSTQDRSTTRVMLDAGKTYQQLMSSGENDCFTQQGHIVWMNGEGGADALPLPSAPRPIETTTATNMLRILDFVPICEFCAASTAKAATGETWRQKGGAPPLIYLLSLTTDAHSANLQLVKHLRWKFEEHRGKIKEGSVLPACIFIVVQSNCLLHQINIAARSTYKQLAGTCLGLLWSQAPTCQCRGHLRLSYTPCSSGDRETWSAQ